MWVNRKGFESGPERGGPARVSEHVMTKQDCTKVDIVISQV